MSYMLLLLLILDQVDSVIPFLPFCFFIFYVLTITLSSLFSFPSNFSETFLSLDCVKYDQTFDPLIKSEILNVLSFTWLLFLSLSIVSFLRLLFFN